MDENKQYRELGQHIGKNQITSKPNPFKKKKEPDTRMNIYG